MKKAKKTITRSYRSEQNLLNKLSKTTEEIDGDKDIVRFYHNQSNSE